MSLTLYFAPGACSLAALAALEETGADYEGVRLVLAEGDQRRPDFLAVNPRGRVPVLIADGQVVTENIAILTAIAQRFPAAGLLPFDDPALLARAYELMSWFASGIHVAFATVFRWERFTDDAGAAVALGAGGKRSVLAAFAELEQILGAAPGGWLLGERFSVLDPYATVFWRWAPRLEIDPAAYPAFDAHARRALARPSVKRALEREAGRVPAEA